MVINTFDIDEAMHFFDDMTVCSHNTTIGTTINEGSCFVRVSRCGNIVGSHWGRDIRAHWGRESCHTDGIRNTINGDITSMGCGISLLGMLLLQ